VRLLTRVTTTSPLWLGPAAYISGLVVLAPCGVAAGKDGLPTAGFILFTLGTVAAAVERTRDDWRAASRDFASSEAHAGNRESEHADE
jgi:hypothetical protein